MEDIEYKDFIIRRCVQDYNVDPDTGERWTEYSFYLWHKKNDLFGISYLFMLFGFIGSFIGSVSYSLIKELGKIGWFYLFVALAIIGVFWYFKFSEYNVREFGFNNVNACKRFIDDINALHKEEKE